MLLTAVISKVTFLIFCGDLFTRSFLKIYKSYLYIVFYAQNVIFKNVNLFKLIFVLPLQSKKEICIPKID